MSAPDISREEWLAMRAGTLGSSEAAAALGEDAYSSPFRLWAEKRGDIDREDIGNRRPVRLGRKLQTVVVEEFAEERGATILTQRRDVEDILTAGGACEVLGWVEGKEPLVRSTRYPWMTATLDAVAMDTFGRPMLVEAKAPGFRQLAKWGEDGTAPDWYRLQVQHALIVVPVLVQVGVLVAIVGGSEYREVAVERDSVPEDAIVTLEREFMRCVETGEHPKLDGSEATREALKKLHPRDTGETLTLPADAIAWHAELAEVSAYRKAAEKRERELKTLIEGAIGSATFGALPDGSGSYSLKTTERDGYVVAPTTYRTLRFAAAKSVTTSRSKQ